MWNFVIPRLQKRILKLVVTLGVGRQLCHFFLKQLPLSPNPPSWDSANLIFPWLAGFLFEPVNRWHRGRLEVWRKDEDMLFSVSFYPYQHHLCNSPSSGCGSWSNSKLWVFYFSGTPEPISCYSSDVSAVVGNTPSSEVWILAPWSSSFKFLGSNYPNTFPLLS